MTRTPSTNRSNRNWFCGIAMGAVSTLLACGGPEPVGSSLLLAGSGAIGSNGTGGIHLNTNASGSGAGGSTGAVEGDGGTCDNNVKAVIRDFRGWPSSASDPGGAADKHPDFEPAVKTAEKGIAASTLGSDQEPVFGNNAGIQTVTSADTFAQWYHDVDGVNMRFEITLPLTPDPNDPTSLAYNNQAYFPIDNEGWGNQGQTHNYSFTTEIHTTFTYKGGESFTFIGDDDVFVYVNNQQVIDLGGIHNAQTGTVNFDQQAATLGLTIGQTYNMDIFHAERHVTESHFRMETKFDCLVSYIIPIQ
jgi:fibro-slime domain-containing protein